MSVEGNGAAVSVTEEFAASGKRSLKVTDAAGLRQRFNPHFYYVPRHHEGVTRCSFDIRVEETTEMYHEWRNEASPYRVGPSVSIKNGKLSAGGTELASLRVNQWVHLEIAARFGRTTAAHGISASPCQDSR